MVSWSNHEPPCTGQKIEGAFFLITIVYIVKEQILDFHKPNQEVNNDTMKHKLSETYAEEFDLRD